MAINFPYCPKGYSIPTERTCDVCGITKPMVAYYERPERPPWKHSHWHATCRQCLLERKHHRYHEDIEASRAIRLKQLRSQKEKLEKVRSTGGISRIVPRDEMRQERDEEHRRSYQRALVRDGMPRVGLLSFAQRASIRRIKDGGEKLLLSLGHEARLGDARADRAAAIWADMSLNMMERQRLLASLRSYDE